MRTASLIVSIAAAAGAAHAQPIFSPASGSDLAGGSLTIEWATPAGFIVGITSAPIVAGGVAGGAAIVPVPFGGPGSAAFIVDGDTATAPWSIANNSGLIICNATFNLNGTSSLFDNDLGGLAAGTPVGLGGVDDVLFLAGSTAPMEIEPTNEFDAWLGGLLPNVGDMWWQEVISWNFNPLVGDTFGGGEVYLWNDDTDLVPAPGTLALIGLAALISRRRVRSTGLRPASE